MTYPEALRYLESFINYEKKDSYDYNKSFKLDRMKKLSSLLGDPQKSINSVHVAGTKGKGSTCAIVHSILKGAGFRAGLYTSPHLVSFRERIRINDDLISQEDVGRISNVVKTAVERLGDDKPSFFEVYTAIAYLYFKEKKVDFAVYEVGMGGRLDATNIIEPLVSCVTPISYEHTQKLGNTLGQIAFEKAGIIKENSICVSAPQEEEALDVIEDACRKRNSKLILVGRDILFKEIESGDKKEICSISGMAGEYPRLKMNLLGRHQVINAATAIGAVEALRFYNLNLPIQAVRSGVEDARWPGRLEVVSRDPFIILDGAQNRASASALALAVKKAFSYKRLILVCGISNDKDIKGIFEELLPITDFVILTKASIAERASDPHRLKEFVNGKGVSLTGDTAEALRSARAMAEDGDLVLVTGSLFVVGEARDILLHS